MISTQETGLGLDLEGPLVNLERDGHHEATLRAARSVGVDLTFEEALVKLPHLIGGPEEKTAEEILILSNSKLITVEEIVRYKKGLFEEWLREVPVIPTRIGVFDFLEDAKRRGLKMMIATSTDPSLAMHYIKHSGLGDTFRMEYGNIVTAGPNIKHKPEPDIYNESARRMEINRSLQLIWEDSVRGVISGVRSGGKVIGLPVYNLERAINPLLEAGAAIIYHEWPEVDLDYLLSESFLFPSKV